MADERPEEAADAAQDEDAPVMPKWVPALIGVVLVSMAALAVYTGLRYRNPPLASGIIKLRHPARSMTGGGAPGEPGPGGSLVLPGDSGDNAPSPNAPVNSRSRAVISGSRAGITSVVHLTARRGMTLNVVPDDAMIFINDTPVGSASQLRATYEFPAPGSYTVRIESPGFKPQIFLVTSSDTATPEVVTIDAKLEKQ
jgi:hypothetical protein